MTDTKPLSFKWMVYRPDQREYRQQSLEIEPSFPTYIEVDVPDDPTYITPNLSGSLCLTLAGLKYVIDQFDTVFLSKKVAPDAQDFATEDEWEEARKETLPKSDDTWEDAEFDEDISKSGKPDEVPWDEDREDWS